MSADPPRGFPEAEYRDRLSRAQRGMASADIGALLLTTEPEVRYFTGYLTRFWESPTRPWFLVVPASGDPIAVIPSIGAHLMRQSWITDIRTWAAPDYVDDGIGLLAETLRDVAPGRTRIGLPSEMESHLRMPLASWAALRDRLPRHDFGGDAGIMRALRLVKSPLEVDKIRAACAVANRAFARVPEIAGSGRPLDAVFRKFQMLCLDEGADWVGYLAGGAGPDGYGDVISPAAPNPLAKGDVLMLDAGCVRDGYYCDFDRNFAVGPPSPDVQSAHARLHEVTHAAFDAARPGATAADLHAVLRIGDAPGRLGHGLGMQLTEWPSLIPADRTPLVPGMVLTLEPTVEVAPGRILVHEENIVVTETGAEWLSDPDGAEIRVLE